MNESRNFKRGKRLGWVSNTIDPVQTEWNLYDSNTQRLRFAKADNQKEAIKKALERNIIPRTTDDVRPRRGKSTDKMMTPDEFDNFIQKIKN